MSGLRDILEAATPGPWYMSSRYLDHDSHLRELDARRCVMSEPARVPVSVHRRSDTRLIALAPELAALVLDAAQAGICRRFTASWCRERPEISEEDWCAWCKWLARLDQLGKEQT